MDISLEKKKRMLLQCLPCWHKNYVELKISKCRKSLFSYSLPKIRINLSCEGISILILGQGEQFLQLWMWKGQWHEALLRQQDCQQGLNICLLQVFTNCVIFFNSNPTFLGYHNSFEVAQSNIIFELHSFSMNSVLTKYEWIWLFFFFFHLSFISSQVTRKHKSTSRQFKKHKLRK